MRDPEFTAGIETAKPELAEQATRGLEGLVPQALQILEDALTGKKVTAQMARVALDTVKAAANIKGNSQAESGTFLAKLRELEAADTVGSD